MCVRERGDVCVEGEGTVCGRERGGVWNRERWYAEEDGKCAEWIGVVCERGWCAEEGRGGCGKGRAVCLKIEVVRGRGRDGMWRRGGVLKGVWQCVEAAGVVCRRGGVVHRRGGGGCVEVEGLCVEEGAVVCRMRGVGKKKGRGGMWMERSGV